MEVKKLINVTLDSGLNFGIPVLAYNSTRKVEVFVYAIERM